MKLLHLSDLHIGKRVCEISMLGEQCHMLEQILELVDSRRPDAVLMAGDIYDKSVPSAEAVTVFDDFLCRLAERGVPTFIISGNHDSAERLAFAARLLRAKNIHISPVYNGVIEPVTLTDEEGDVNFYLLPFLKPAHVKRFYGEEKIESYTDACRVAIKKMGIDENQRNVLLAHQFVTGAEKCESEELSVGGTDNVDASVFEKFDYTALGHLHGPQNVLSPRIRYSGTMLKYSFSEEHHHKSVTMVHLGKKGQLELELCPLTPLHDLRSIRGSFEEVTSKAFYANQNCDDYLHIVLTDEDDISEAVGQLRLIYPNLMKLSYDNTRTRENRLIEGATQARRSPLELFEELFELQNNCPMTQEQRTFALELIESIGEGSL